MSSPILKCTSEVFEMFSRAEMFISELKCSNILGGSFRKKRFIIRISLNLNSTKKLNPALKRWVVVEVTGATILVVIGCKNIVSHNNMLL